MDRLHDVDGRCISLGGDDCVDCGGGLLLLLFADYY
jgi:hypothetical protein